MANFNLSEMMTGVAQKTNPQVSAMPTMSSTGTPAATMPSGVPSWMDAYTEYTNQDWFKKQQAAYGGQIDRRWNADDGTRAAKNAIDELYKSKLSQYNLANGGNYAVDQSMLGADAQPNDWNRQRNASAGFLNQIGDGISSAIGTDSSEHGLGKIGKELTSNPLINSALVAAGSIYGGPAGAAGVNGLISRAQGNDWSQVASNAAGAAALSYGVGQVAPGLSGGGTDGFMNTIGAGGTGATTSAVTGGTPGVTGTSLGTLGTAAPEASSMYSLAGGTGTLGSASAAGTSAGMAGSGLSATAAPTIAGMGGGTGVLGSLGATVPSSSVSSILSNMGNIKDIVKAGSSLYSAYQGQQGAKQTQDILNNQMTTLADMYKEGSPWANQLKEQLARKDAAAGRNSQYGSRLAQYQALLADQAGKNAGVLGQLATQAGAANKDANGYLNLLLNRAGDLADSTGLSKYVSNKAEEGIKSAWDYFLG